MFNSPLIILKRLLISKIQNQAFAPYHPDNLHFISLRPCGKRKTTGLLNVGKEYKF
jgi:hypothetical protein